VTIVNIRTVSTSLVRLMCYDVRLDVILYRKNRCGNQQALKTHTKIVLLLFVSVLLVCWLVGSLVGLSQNWCAWEVIEVRARACVMLSTSETYCNCIVKQYKVVSFVLPRLHAVVSLVLWLVLVGWLQTVQYSSLREGKRSSTSILKDTLEKSERKVKQS
jgi:hypothetical protein